MRNNKFRETLRTPRLIILSVFFLTSLFLYAQNTDDNLESKNTVVKTPEGLVIRQIISFPALENSIRYEIEIEERRQSSWVPVQKMETNTNSFEVSLAAGDYRYRYSAYNSMNLFEGRSNWQNFRLTPAVAPSPESFRPFYGMYYEMSDPGNVLIVYGSDFSDKTEFALVKRKKDYDWSGVALQERKDAIIPASAEISNNQARLTFTRDSLKRGSYQIFARNPGGLWACFGEVRVGHHSAFDFLFDAGYSPAFSEDGFYNSQYFRIGWFPLKTKIGYWGLGSQLFSGNRTNENNDMFFSINLLYQYAASERLAHNIRLGIMPLGDGYWVDPVWDYDEYGNRKQEPKVKGYDEKETYIYVNAGYSLQYFFWKNFYAAAGIDVLYALSTDTRDKSTYFLNPAIGIGFQPGRWSDYTEVAKGKKRGEDYSVPVTSRPKGEHILAVGWLPMIPVYGIDFYGDRRVDDQTLSIPVQYNEQGEHFLNTFNPLGFNVRYAYIPHLFGKNKFGYEFELSYLHHENISLPEGGAPFENLFFGIRYQRVLHNSLYLNARVSAGIAKAYNFSQKFKKWNEWTEDRTSHVEKDEEYIKGGEPGFALNTGVSLQYFFWKNMFAQASADMLVVFGEKTNIQFRPGLSLGWQFNRGSETGLRLPGSSTNEK